MAEIRDWIKFYFETTFYSELGISDLMCFDEILMKNIQNL